ncbi:divalent cation tolerance protein [Tranquillimonas rosea]|uniref:Divalent cation tolerance protein n=1 Tax=Tranquillimonas rosea TaxID=641238 RepID=A0A1H9RQG9_9RHOB|nr:divalent-cation tolerance protein CutA [Tranquillimonas rosea]SER74139.1 divalent cation tolerance protein [Tranquillimonas rosea]
MTQPVTLSVPCPDRDCALSLARAAVAGRLAACANIYGPVTSVFTWNDAVEEEDEHVLTLKTVAARVDELATLLQTRHPYDVPAITWETCSADDDTLTWLADETR